MSFSKDFIWGAATSAYQIEGAADADGKGLSIWDVFSKEHEKTYENHNGDNASNHYYYYKDDVQLMKQIGLKSYSFTISWSRIFPDGIGKINQKGLDFYENLVDELLKADIIPIITIYHWDMPFNLHCRGGWLNPDSSLWFAEYTKVLIEKFSDRVKKWITICEPQCFINEGYLEGLAAPGYRMGYKEVLLSFHNVLLAHGRAVQTIRSYSKQKCDVGLTSIGVIKIPESESNQDIELARKAMFSINSRDFWNNTWCLDPVLLGKYPDDGLKLFHPYVPEIKSDDMKIISEPIDFLGLTVYEGAVVQGSPTGEIVDVPFNPGHPYTTMKFPIIPSCLYWGPKFYYERYKKPLYITENGIAFYDTIALDGEIHDPQRTDYLHRHFLEIKKAIQEGVDLRGYYYWSFMDNLEWQDGYKERFGLIHVDFNTFKRTIKNSAFWYKKVIESNGNNL